MPHPLRRRRLLLDAEVTAPFSPSSLTGLKLWLRADAGVWQDAARTIVASADGDVVGGWTDLSGQGNHVTQAITSKKPLLKMGPNGINSSSVVRGDGADDMLKLASAAFTMTSGTAITVYRFHAFTGMQTLVGSSNSAGASTFVFLGLGNNAAPYNGYPFIYRAKPATTDNIIRGSTSSVEGTVYLGVYQSTGAAYALALGNTAETVTVQGGSNNGSWFGDLSGLNSTSLFWLDVTASPLTQGTPSDIAEVLVYEPQLSATNLAKVITYLNARWGL